MITEVILPKLGQTMEEGAIIEWLKAEGDPVQRGDILFTVESDKAVLEVEATARGFLRKILVPAGHTVPVLTVVALITRQAEEDISSFNQTAGMAVAEPAVGAPPIGTAPAEPGVRELIEREAPGRIFASPRARKAAHERGVDLALLSGSGPSGRIVERDVLDYASVQPRATPVARRTAEALGVDLSAVTGTGITGRITKSDVTAAIPEAAPRPVEALSLETIPMTGLRRIIAERMSASHTATARVTLVTEADATSFVNAREQLKASISEEWGFAPGYNDLLGIIVARALSEFPYMNARLSQDGEFIEQLPKINLGIAVDTERGLLVPVIRDAEKVGLHALGAELRALVERARLGKSLPDDLSGGTFTITNLGMYDIDAFTPIINPPETAILGVGRIQAKPVVYNDEVAVRQMWTLSLTFDHRLVDGAPAARFLQRIKNLIENPFLLLG